MWSKKYLGKQPFGNEIMAMCLVRKSYVKSTPKTFFFPINKNTCLIKVAKLSIDKF